VVNLQRLGLGSVRAWLRRHGIVGLFVGPDRMLRGCLVACGGAAIVFLEQDDDEAERRFSLAHEVAHFLRDYCQPREEAVRCFGRCVLEVLDGLRPPDANERLHAVLRNVRIGFHTHFLARDPGGHARGAAAVAEREADQLAYELLAPADHVRPRRDETVAALARRLHDDYGLPLGEGGRYATLLLPSSPPRDPLITRLRGAADLSNFRPPGGNR
jgi:hypothetical protein